MQMELLVEIIGNVGFPIAVSAFLLIRIENKLDELNKILISMIELLAKNND
nr:YvrJ family protein [Anaerophilus nitritogenes]